MKIPNMKIYKIRYCLINYPIKKIIVTNTDNIYFINNVSQDTIHYFNSYYIYFDLSKELSISTLFKFLNFSIIK